MEANDDVAREPDAPSVEGELIEPGPPPATRPPGRKPVAPLHLIAPLTAEEISMLTGDPNEVIRRRTADYLNWAHALVSASPSRLNRVAFGVESQRRMVDKLLSLAVPPARQAGDPFGNLAGARTKNFWRSSGALARTRALRTGNCPVRRKPARALPNTRI
jgi:hypothetical protein